MKKITFTLIFIIQLVLSQSTFAQLFSILDQGITRTYIVHLPSGYNANSQYPLVINLHGLNSDAAQQESYSQFDNVADNNNFIVVYPNANAGSWVVNGTSDVDFISHLIDTIRSNYNCNNCLFLIGMSQGGFLAYKLACSLSQPINAIAVVSGNMSQNLQNNCAISAGIPVMHFHGTSDPLVNYNGTFGIPTVPTTINWWVNKNNCDTNPVFTLLPNTNLSDNSNVEKYYYDGGINASEVTFFKIINGGHTWPGATSIPAFGETNLDINASQIIGSFFSQYCSANLEIHDYNKEKTKVFPNPFSDKLKINSTIEVNNYYLSNSIGQLIWEGKNIEQQDFSHLKSGLYYLKIATTFGKQIVKLIKE
jgi:polyhydroxybutyrate depolymerase